MNLTAKTAFSTLVNQAKQQIKRMSVNEVFELIQKDYEMVVIDVREESEWRRGHLPHAIHLSKGVIEVEIEEKIPDNKKTLILYCGGGSRSALAALNLKQMGYKNVISMDGGFRTWVSAGLPTH